MKREVWLTGGLLFFMMGLSSIAGGTVLVGSVGALLDAVESANNGGDKTILIADGTYDLSGVALFITVDGVTVRSASGNRSGVVLDSHYVEAGTTGIFRIVSSSVTIADLTLKRPYYHAIHISPAAGRSTENILIQNVHIIDPGEQAIKINPDDPYAATYTVNNSTIKNCLIELTDTGRTQLTSDYPCYTGGIDGHWAGNWTVQDNVIRGFWCSDALSEHGIHFWNNSSNIVVERNRIIDCDRGIGFGLGEQGNSGGIIRNNMIYHGPDHGYSDVGISLESTPDAQVYNNTVFHVHAYPAIEYRFAATTGALIANNLTNRDIWQRDGASGTESRNLTAAQASWFVNAVAGDLHLASAVSGVIDQGMALTGLTDDFDKEKRPQGRGIELGADEVLSGAFPGTLSWLMLLLGK
ncbi:MAG: right-handed parallel beta-helix repeat-containing protein [Desulfobulbaceae bacterium]